MSCRLFVPPEALTAGDLEVTGDDHHYLFRVRRLRPGDPLTLFDGAGREAAAEVAWVRGEAASLRVAAPLPAPAPARPRVVALLSLLKGDRMDWCLAKLTELGIDEIVPVRAARSVVVLDGARADRRRDRYLRQVREAAKQSRSARAPEVAPVCELDAALAQVEALPLKLVLWEDPGAAPLRSALPEAAPSGIALLVGPEGGLADDELSRARAAGFVPVGLGPRILRAETAPLAAAAILGFLFGDLS